jgi:DUF4097 and DUF4098 domain-containing protein YvlB
VNLEAGNGIVSADISELRGEGRFATGNGDVAVVIRSGQVPISASTVNGSVSLRLPGNFDGFLDARTANGRVRSDFSVTGAGWVGVNRIRGSIGSGGDPTIKLWSTNGNVWLRKGA